MLIKSKHQPNQAPANRNDKVESLISNVTTQVAIVNKRSRRKWCNQKHRANLSTSCKKAISELASLDEVVVKKIDKGNTLAVLDRKQYLAMGFEHLEDESVYEQSSSLEFEESICRIRTVLLQLEKAGAIGSELIQFMDPCNFGLADPSKMYFLPKTHKLGRLKGRPILSSCKAPTSHISALIDQLILPIAMSQPTYLKDSKSMVKLLKLIKYKKGVFMAVWDLVSMYVSIPHEVALEQLRVALEKHTSILEKASLSVATVLELTKLVITNNFFSFNGLWYRQIKGLAMGSRASPELADIAVFELESKLIELAGQWLDWWVRYRDDIFFMWSGSAETYIKFAKLANEFVPYLSFDQMYSQQAVNLLDLTIYAPPATKSSLQFKLYVKPCNTRQFFPPCSSHTPETKKGLVTGELTRYWQNSSEFRNFVASAEQLFNELQIRGFHPSAILKPARQFMTRHVVDRTLAIKPKIAGIETVFLPLKFFSGHKKLKNRLKIAVDQFKSNNTKMAAEMGVNNLVVAFSVLPNLSNTLVRASLKSSANSSLENLIAIIQASNQ